MKMQNLIAAVAAVAFTTASLATVSYQSAPKMPALPAASHAVTELAPIVVHPSAEDLRAAALAVVDTAPAMPAVSGRTSDATPLATGGLIGTELAMPYYSFAHDFGRIGKE